MPSRISHSTVACLLRTTTMVLPKACLKHHSPLAVAVAEGQEGGSLLRIWRSHTSKIWRPARTCVCAGALVGVYVCAYMHVCMCVCTSVRACACAYNACACAPVACACALTRAYLLLTSTESRPTSAIIAIVATNASILLGSTRIERMRQPPSLLDGRQDDGSCT